MRTRIGASAVTTALLLLIGCTPSDSERCQSGYLFHPENGSCQPIEDGGTDSETSNLDAGNPDAGNPDGGDTGDLPTGLGESCTDNEQCADYEADYCAINPLTQEGFCTVENCTVSPDDCPQGYRCCDSPESYGQPNLCILPADYDTLHGAGLCA
ncbi:MAG: hypothetical protein PHU25_02520 [Deltaproteobacteria bacterium]|nr:hypothetical protein [Deltaproteobacteria bacterium]